MDEVFLQKENLRDNIDNKTSFAFLRLQTHLKNAIYLSQERKVALMRSLFFIRFPFLCLLCFPFFSM